MSKPDDIPQDVWDAAVPLALQYVEWLIPAPHDYAGSEDVLTKVIARAIMVERERCAKVADDYPSRDPAGDGNGYWAAEEIAAAIRGGAQP